VTEQYVDHSAASSSVVSTAWPHPLRGQDMLLDYMIWYINCNWVDTRWQWYSTHLHTNTVHRTTQWDRIHRTEHT